MFYTCTDNDQNRIEIEGVPITAVIKVKDHPGALWSALWEIGVSFIIYSEFSLEQCSFAYRSFDNYL